jgi:hypothetical protein
MFSLIPLPYKIIMIVMLLGGAVGFGYMKGSEAGKIAIANLKADSERQIHELEDMNAKISNKVVTQYVDRVNTIHEKEKVYVDAAKNNVPSQSILSNGWVYTHDISATSGDADATRSSDASPSGIKDNEALLTILGNYSICHENSEQLKGLEQWVIDNKKAVDESNAKKETTSKKRFGIF